MYRLNALFIFLLGTLNVLNAVLAMLQIPALVTVLEAFAVVEESRIRAIIGEQGEGASMVAHTVQVFVAEFGVAKLVAIADIV